MSDSKLQALLICLRQIYSLQWCQWSTVSLGSKTMDYISSLVLHIFLYIYITSCSAYP